MRSCSAVRRGLARNLSPYVVNGRRVALCACLRSVLILGVMVSSADGAQPPRRPAAAPAQPARFKADLTLEATSFFICTGPAPTLDGKYTAFGHVIDGLAAVEAIEAVPVEGEAPRERVEVTKVTVTSE